MRLLLTALVLVPAVGCAAAPHAPSNPAAVAAAEPTPSGAIATDAPQPTEAGAAAGVAEVSPLPAVCAKDEAGICEADPDFAQRLCSSTFPEVALSFFSKGTPWTRAYLTGSYDAWNASGGMSSKARLAFDEEVLVLQRRAAPASSIVVTGNEVSYDVLRWDGTCVSLTASEVTLKRPPQAKFAAIPWRRLSEATRSALLAAPKVATSQKDVNKECVGESAGLAKAKCEKADHAFDKAIVEFVRAGGVLPAPSRRP